MKLFSYIKHLQKVTFLLAFILLLQNNGFGVAITPIRTDVTGFGTWTDVSIAGTTYLQMNTPATASKTISPTMDFTPYSTITLDFKARTLNGTNAALNTITVSISTDGATWTTLGTRIPLNNVLNVMTQFNLSAYNINSTVRIRFETIASNGTIGAGIDDITIDGIVPAGPTLTVSPTSLSGFTYFQGSGPSTSLSYNLSGSLLTGFPGNITVTGSTNYEVSTDNISFSGSISVPYATATLAATPIYVRLKAGLLLGTYNGEIIANSGGGATTKNVTCNGNVTVSAASDVVTANGESATISSLVNDAATLTSATGAQVWQFTVRDGGSLNNDADNLPTIVSGFTLTQNVGNQIDNWLDAIKTIALFDGVTWIANATSVTATTVVFSGLSVNVADNTNKTLSLRLSLNCPLNNVGAGNLDGDDFVFNMTNPNFTTPTDGTSSTKAAFAVASTINGQNAVSIVATQLAFVQQPTNTGTAETMTPSVTVSATDICGNVDIGFSGTVSITSSGTLSVTPITATFTAGVATITPIIHTVAETGVVLTASCAGLTSATSSSFEIYPYVGIPDNGCATSTYATSIINYPTDYIITDVNVGVKISHTYRGDLNISLVAPNGTTVLLIASVGGTANNLDGIIDDQAAANQFSIVSNHVIDGVYDVNGKPEGTGTGLLSTFNGLSSLGNWTLKICDDAGADIGGVISWEIFITGTSPCAFSAGAITGAPFSVNCSTGSTGSVAYSSSCTFTGNTFTAQLSNASGSFASPTTIGTSVSDVNTGSINISIPAGIVTGAGYLIRIISTSPIYTSTSSAVFTITNTVPCTITPGVMTGAPFNVTCSTGASGTIAFTSSASYSGNTYTVQLSNAAGSFASPTNIGSLVSNANTGTINFTIPSGVPSGAGYLIRLVSNGPSVVGSSSASLSITLTGSPCQAFEIQSILIDACGNPEGGNEMVRLQTGGSPLNTSDITTSWPNSANIWRGICQNSSTAATVAAINATITAGGMLVEPIGGVIPANAQVMFFTSTSFAASLYNFSTLNYTLYAIFQCSGNTAGHFVNSSGTNPTNRTLTIAFTGYGTDAVTYNAYNVYNGDGGSVDYTPAGVPTYGSTGGCIAPIFVLPIKLLYFTASLNGSNVDLNWATTTEINNDYFTVERSADAINFEPILTENGAGNSSTTLLYSDIDQSPLTGVSYYRLKQTDFDGKYSYSNIASVKFENKEGFQIIKTFGSIENGYLNITINCGADCMVNFELYDMTGKMVRSTSQNINDINTTYSIPTKGLSEGIYLIKAFNGDKVITKKIKL